MKSPIEMMSHVHGKPKRMTLEATITRADGTIEHLGIIADSSRYHRFIAKMKSFFSRLF